jgi:hypothetical protein
VHDGALAHPAEPAHPIPFGSTQAFDIMSSASEELMKLNDKLRLAVLCLLATLAVAAYKVQTVPEMVKAANNLLVTLTPEQKAKIQYPFAHAERINFHFTPVTRQGLPFKEMTPEQTKLAHALLATGVSQKGYIKATTIMSLEEVLRGLEAGGRGGRGGRGGFVRDPDNYFFTIFGEPSETGTWGLRVEGHHLTLNFTIDKGKVLAHTPAFMGANPAEVRTGPRTGLRALGTEEDLARSLILSLDAQQKQVAILPGAPPNDIRTGENFNIDNIPNFDINKPTGLQASRLNARQQEALIALIEEFAYRMPIELADATMTEVKKPGLDKVYLTWVGGTNKGEQYYYRVHGPSFLIELNNTQNQGNHVHSVWRDLKNDFGRDVLKEHLQTAHAQ